MSKIYLNIQEQVEKNREDILALIRGAKTLADFGIKVVGFVTSVALLPDPTTYQGDFGDAYAVGDDPDVPPFDYYVFTRPFQGETSPQWFNIGEFPKEGPQGETGEAGRGIVSIAFTSRAGLTDTYTITYSDGTTSTFEVKNGAKGDTGIITGATASVDNSVGTPSVTVENLGTPEQRSFNFKFYNLKGVQGEKGDPGAFFILAGQVANSSLLPDADSVDANKAYLVGASAPYDVYAILSVGTSHYWINLGPVAVQQSDTKVGALTFSSTGTLPAEVLDEIVNTTTADFLKIGDRYFVKQSTGHYYALKRDSGEMLVYALDIDLSTGAWEITTETMVDLDSPQTITGVKDFQNGIKVASLIRRTGSPVAWITNSGDDTVIYKKCYPYSDASNDLGTSGRRWKDGNFSGKVYAENTFNVINASDIVSNTLTQDQYDLITNGKPTLIKGTLGTLGSDIWLFSPKESSDYWLFMGVYQTSSLYNNTFGMFDLNKTTRVFNTTSPSAPYIRIQNVNVVNGKTIPAYPTSNANKQIITIAANGGSLAWEDFVALTNPMTTQGDIIYGGASGTPTRLAKGSSGQILEQGSNGPVWSDKDELYEHTIRISWTEGSLILRYYDHHSGSYVDDHKSAVENLYEWYDFVIGEDVYIPCTGWFKDSNSKYNPVYMFYFHDTSGTIYLNVPYVRYDGSNQATGAKAISGTGASITSFTDEVRKIV